MIKQRGNKSYVGITLKIETKTHAGTFLAFIKASASSSLNFAFFWIAKAVLIAKTSLFTTSITRRKTNIRHWKDRCLYLSEELNDLHAVIAIQVCRSLSVSKVYAMLKMLVFLLTVIFSDLFILLALRLSQTIKFLTFIVIWFIVVIVFQLMRF